MPANSKHVEDILLKEINGTFPNAQKRLRVWAEVDKFKWKEDESVWNQKKGNEMNTYEVYFDTEFVCHVEEKDGEFLNRVKFLEGIKKLYKENKIFVHEEMYKVVDAAKDAAFKESNTVKLPSARNEAEHLVSEAIKKRAKKQGKKVVQK